ncbi:juvenile hormone esterase [Anabrus simplex]|uniref:juvenile hormone esterase n=1 Tax=Anabrus simplex TaxID=316456 RepID=UPI0035A30692
MATTPLAFALLILTAHQLGEVLCDDEYPTITLPQGTLKGKKVTPENLSPYYSFLGIPYAKPPLGNLRFKAPVPAGPWNGTLEALQEGNMCKQPPNVFGRASQSEEDCLFLNVYTPELPGSGPLRPVMVWIHGGGFLAGSGNREKQGPQYLLDKGIVYVSLNYRLGVFGFLSTEDEVVPGNAGMKDQVLALRWIQQNIAAFGGDPDQVTIFGQSAGGDSVHYHMLSPMSKGLFHGVIAQSGGSSRALAIARKPRENAFLVGKALGYTGESSQELIDFLRNVSSDELLSTAVTTVNVEDEFRLLQIFHELPCVEPVIEGETGFITEDPLTLLEEGKFHKVPFLTGVTLTEGLLLLSMGVFKTHRTWEEIDKDFVKTIKPELRICGDESCGDAMVPKIRSFYLGDQPLSNNPDTLQSFIDMCTDLSFADGVLHEVKTMSSLSSAPVYFYQFSYDGGLVDSIPALANFTRPTHSDDLGYIFDFGIQVADDSLDAKVRSRMVTMWTNFVKAGNPTPEVTEDIPAWLPYTNNATNYMDIGSQLVLKKDYHKERMDFWDDLYSLK